MSASEFQVADVFVTKQFLQVKIWQLSVTHSLLANPPDTPGRRVAYPLFKLAETMEALSILP